MRSLVSCLSAVAIAILVVNTAQAGILGHSVDIQYVWPSVGSVFQDLGTITVTSSPQTETFQPYFNVTLSDGAAVVDGSNYTGVYSGTFNGEYLIDLSALTFPAYTIDPSSVLSGGSPIITTVGNVLEINFAGLVFQPGDQLVLDLGPRAVPEPASLALFGAGLAGFGAMRRRRQAKA